MAVPDSMQAIAITAAGGPDVLRSVSLPSPEPGAGEVLLRVCAAGVNRPDCLQRQGLYPLPPDASPLPGLEVAGEVVALGQDAPRWQIGDRVVALTHGGGYAEFCAVAASHCLPWPVGFSAAEAASLPETTFTVQHNLFTRARLTSDEWLLVHGGSSGIGSTAIQLAKARGARVVTTVGNAQKQEFCTALGADAVLNYRTDDWESEIGSVTADRGVNVVLDMVAGPYVAKNFNVLAQDGRYAMIAFLLGAKAEVNFAHLLRKRLTMTGSTLRPQSVPQKAAIARDVETHCWPLLASNKLRAVVYEVFPLAAARDAHALMESSNHMGKIVLSVAEDE